MVWRQTTSVFDTWRSQPSDAQPWASSWARTWCRPIRSVSARQSIEHTPVPCDFELSSMLFNSCCFQNFYFDGRQEKACSFWAVVYLIHVSEVHPDTYGLSQVNVTKLEVCLSQQFLTRIFVAGKHLPSTTYQVASCTIWASLNAT